MQGGEPLTVRSSAKRVKRGTGWETADRKSAPLRHQNLLGLGVGPGPARAIGGIGGACLLGVRDYGGAE